MNDAVPPPTPLRVSLADVAPGAREAMLGLERYLADSDLDAGLLELVRIRASQLNGCTHCLDMHVRDARRAGETDRRLALIAAWRDADVYAPRERVALAWTEALTYVAERPPAAALYEEARRTFGERDLADLTLAVVAINGWNRLRVALGGP